MCPYREIPVFTELFFEINSIFNSQLKPLLVFLDIIITEGRRLYRGSRWLPFRAVVGRIPQSTSQTKVNIRTDVFLSKCD